MALTHDAASLRTSRTVGTHLSGSETTVLLNQYAVSMLQNFRQQERLLTLVATHAQIAGPSGCQDYLANIPAFFHIGLRLTDPREREALIHMRANPAIRDTLEQYFHPARNHVGLVPHVAEVHPEHGSIGVHQRERMEERRAERDGQQAQRPRQL